VETKANDKPSLEEIETKAWEALQKKRSNAKAKSQPASKNGNKKKVETPSSFLKYCFDTSQCPESQQNLWVHKMPWKCERMYSVLG
jgi:hypothetical protein